MKIDYSSIGRVIREKRKAKKISQEVLAKSADIGIAHISHIESGSTIPSLKTFIAILNSLDASADEILRGNLKKSKYVLDGELAETMASCRMDESVIIADTIRALKSSLKKNRYPEAE
jgi:transcriptional regulator with XRE-family HTH domain